MPLALSLATAADAARIAEIHMAAFRTNGMLHAQFPTPIVRAGLQISIEKKALADIKDPHTTVLVVRDHDQENEQKDGRSGRPDAGNVESRSESKVVGFAKWAHPVSQDADYVEPAWEWPEGTNWEVLDRWIKKTTEVQDRIMGRRLCYRLNFIGTDPSHQRRGAARLMVQWGIEQCQRDRVPAYLESTVEAAPLYLKMGFRAVEVFSMQFRGVTDDLGNETYEEISFLFEPL